MQHALAYHTCCTYLLITNVSHDNYNSNCDAATVKALEMGVLYFETGGMKHNAPAAVKLEADFSVLLHTSQTSCSGWLDRLGTAMGPCVCSFNVQQRSRTKKHQGLNKVKEDSVSETGSVTCFPQPHPTKDSLCNLLRCEETVIHAEYMYGMDDITVQTHSALWDEKCCPCQL